MNAYQNSKFRMYHTVYNCLIANKDVWGPVPGFVALVDNFKLLLNTISGLVGEKARKLAGVSLSKSKVKSELCDMALVISGVLVATADESKNFELQKAMDFSRSELEDMVSEELGPVCRQILGRAELHKAAMAAFNITDTSLADFDRLITEFDQMTTAPRKAISERKTMGETLKALFAETDNLVKKRLDKVAEVFRKDNTRFYYDYKNNRKIVNQGSRPTQLTGIITDKTGNKPLKNVLVAVEGTDFLTNSKADGSFILKIPQTGLVAVRFAVGGYVTSIKEDVELKLGRNTGLSVGLERAS